MYVCSATRTVFDINQRCQCIIPAVNINLPLITNDQVVIKVMEIAAIFHHRISPLLAEPTGNYREKNYVKLPTLDH